MNLRPLVVRVVDVGYGHVTLSDGRDPDDQSIRTDSIPSQSSVTRQTLHKAAGIMNQRDTFIVPIGERRLDRFRV